MTDGFFLLCSKFWKDWCFIFNWYFVIDWLIGFFIPAENWMGTKRHSSTGRFGQRHYPSAWTWNRKCFYPPSSEFSCQFVFRQKHEFQRILFRYFRIDMLRLKMENAKLVEKLKTQLEMPRTADTTARPTLIPDVVGHTEKLSEYATNVPASEANEAELIPDRLDAIPVSFPSFFARARYSWLIDWLIVIGTLSSASLIGRNSHAGILGRG